MKNQHLFTLGFITKLIIISLLAFFTVIVAGITSGGGHGNYFSFFLFLGPTSFLLAVIKSKYVGMFMIFAIICLFETYALLINFCNSRYIIHMIFIFHFLSGLLAILFSIINKPLLFFSASDLFLNLIILIPFSFIIIILVLIYKKRHPRKD